MNREKKTVVVAMSGGVDSSVVAALLTQQDHEVIGMMLRLWSEDGRVADNRCCTPEAMGLARRVAAQLGIPFYVVDVQEAFRTTVVQSFIDGYAKGITPNPCLVCNRQIRWGFLWAHAQALGADLLATGHYARLRKPAAAAQLLRAVDPQKDQSYVLSTLPQDKLKHSLFPLGEFTKAHVRALADQFHLPVADRPDSQDLCFIPDDYRSFLRRHAPELNHPGPIVDRHHNLLGQHRGLAFYTIGQRRGLGLHAPQPLFVLDKILADNTLIVGPREARGRTTLLAKELNWISGRPPLHPFRARVKTRYRARRAWAEITPLENKRAKMAFEEPIADLTPGQLAAIYDGEICLGGGLIECVLEG